MPLRAALLVPLALVAGLALGFVLSRGTSARVIAREGLTAPATLAPPERVGQHRGDEVALLRAEIERLRAQIVERREATAAGAEATAAASAPSAPESVADGSTDPAGARDARLEAELLRALSELESFGSRHRNQFAWFMTTAYVQAERSHEALAMLERLEVTDGDLYATAASGLEQAGDPAAAAQALERGLALDSSSTELANRLVGLDPARAVAALDRALAAEEPPGAPAKRLSRAGALLALGREAEARVALDGLVADDPSDVGVLEALGRIDPVRAEALLRARMAAGDDAGVPLARLLASQGRSAEAAALYQDLLAGDPNHAGARVELLELDPELAFQSIQRAAQQQARDPELWYTLGEQWLARGDPQQAIEAWLGAFEREPGNSEWEQRLLEHAPARLIAAYEAGVRGSDDDELWGDLADTYWRQGRVSDARAAWQRAARLDPGDGEWSGKLAALAAGQDPLE
jgi:tetratricopeptide (TPR) repeat protein